MEKGVNKYKFIRFESKMHFEEIGYIFKVPCGLFQYK